MIRFRHLGKPKNIIFWVLENNKIINEFYKIWKTYVRRSAGVFQSIRSSIYTEIPTSNEKISYWKKYKILEASTHQMARSGYKL